MCEARKEKADLICQVLIKEMSESEPADDASRRQNMLPKPRKVEFSGTRIAETYLLAIRQPSYRGHDFYLGLWMERRKPYINAKGKNQVEQLQDDYQCSVRWRTNP